jgi:Neutral/alkaline non-lysosomal ceramidase, N-terminal
VGLIKPIEWVPFVLPHQIFQIGQLSIVAVPGEFTTMSGRRLKLTIKQALQDAVRDESFFFKSEFRSEAYVIYQRAVVRFDLFNAIVAATKFLMIFDLILEHLDNRQSCCHRWSFQ